MYLYARDDPPLYIANWLVGSDGEQRKEFGGEVTVEDDRATVRRLEDPSLSYRCNAGKGVVPLALDVPDRLTGGTRATQYVHALVVVWGQFPQRVAEGRCAYVHGDELLAWLRPQPLRVAPQRVEQFSAVRGDADCRASAPTIAETRHCPRRCAGAEAPVPAAG